MYSSGVGSVIIYGTVATYSCDEGFILQGSLIRSCSGDGSTPLGAFDGVEPVCSGNYLLLSSF